MASSVSSLRISSLPCCPAPSADRNAGFSRGNPQQLYLPVIIDPEYHYEALNVESQQNNANSLLWYMKRLLALRKESAVLGRGTIEFLHPDNNKILAFVREYQSARVLIVANLSRFVQCVELDLAKHQGMVPVEMFGRMRFPLIGESPYFVTLGPHAFYWLDLQPATAAEEPLVVTSGSLRHVSVDGPWHALLSGKQAKALERVLPGYLKTCRWFGGKARHILSVRIMETVAVPMGVTAAHVALMGITYADGDPETYLLPLGFAVDDRAMELSDTYPQAVIAQVTERSGDGERQGLVYDALYEPRFAAALAAVAGRGRRLKGTHGEVAGFTTRGFRGQVREASETLQPAVLGAEQSNTSITFGDRLIMKVLRRMDAGVNPDLEVGRFLTERTAYKDTAAVAGGLEYRRSRGEPVTLGIIHRFVPNEGDAWQYTLDALGRYFDQVAARARAGEAEAAPRTHIVARLADEIPSEARESIGLYLESARMLGERTASLHLALASRSDDPAFAPEAFSTMYQRSLYQSVRSRAEQSLSLL
jgi:maltose alpha-D-glucosyltransferase/alpha-amylase